MRGPVGALPESLGGRGLQQLVGAVAGDLAQPAGDRPGQFLGVAGQDFAQFLLDVDVFVELVDEVVADRFADRRVLDQPVAGVDPVVGVERLALGPDREDAEEGEHRAEHDQRFHRASASAAHRRMLYVTDEARGNSPHHRDHRGRAAQRRLLRGGDGPAAGEENGQPGQPDRLPPLLRRREGQRRLRPHLLRVPRRAPGRAGAGDVHRIVWRVGSDAALDFWEERLAANGIASERAGGGLRFSDPEGLDHELAVVEVADEPLIADHPEVPGRAGAAGIPRGPRLQRRARARAAACSRRSSSSRSTSTAGRPAAPAAAASTYTTSRPRSGRCRAPAASTTSPGPRPSRSTSSGASGRSRAAPSRPR